jgi:hypothetical protein
MRRVVVVSALVGMLGVVAAMAAMRERPQWLEVASEPDAGEGAGEGAAEGAAAVEGATKGEGAAKAEGATPTAEAEPAAPKLEPEPLRVVALGWEVLAPGVQANGGLEPGTTSRFRDAGLQVTLAAVADAAELEARLSRGGEDERGADVALMPLPVFVASYERLRALSPQVFFVVAWSRGRDAMVGDAELLRAPPSGQIRLSGAPGAPETLLALFALSQAGVSPKRVELVQGSAGPRPRTLAAVQRRRSGELDARTLVLSTADATHLVPVVAVAPAGVVQRRRGALVKFSRTWMEGARTLDTDPAATARLVATQPGAPEVVDLIDALGWLDFTDLQGAATAAGLSGRGAVNLDALFHRTWTLWRDVGLLTTPPPEHVPLTATVIADLAQDVAPPAAAKPRRDTSEDAPVLLTHAVPGRRLDAAAEAALVAEVGFLAGVFSRSTVEVWVPRSPDAAARVAVHVAERFGLPADRVVARKDRDDKAKRAALVTVRAAQ